MVVKLTERRVYGRRKDLAIRLLIVMNICFLFGAGCSVVELHKTIHILTGKTNKTFRTASKGKRNTAGNGWQVSELARFGIVDMEKYPDGLKPLEGTWINGFLRSEGLIVNDPIDTWY